MDGINILSFIELYYILKLLASPKTWLGKINFQQTLKDNGSTDKFMNLTVSNIISVFKILLEITVHYYIL